jgi:hypothetical protein
MLFHAPWYFRLALFVPAAIAAMGLLQATRHTCVARVAQGTIEHDDFSTSKAPADQLAASRKVAVTIHRDTVLIALGAALVGAASALVS